MRCTRCSELVRPVVALDIDGTLGDYHGHFLRFAADWLGVSWWSPELELTYDGAMKFSDWFMSMFACDLTTFRAIKLAYRQGGMKRTMPVVAGAPGLVQSVADAGAELWLTTTRPYLSLDGIDRDTRAWLSRNYMTYHHLLYDEHKYSVLLERVERERVVAILDDELEQCDAAATIMERHVPIQISTRYNAGARFQGRRVTRLNSAAEVIVNRITKWKEQHV